MEQLWKLLFFLWFLCEQIKENTTGKTNEILDMSAHGISALSTSLCRNAVKVDVYNNGMNNLRWERISGNTKTLTNENSTF